MSLKGLIRKLSQTPEEGMVEEIPQRKISPNEMELMVFREKARQAKIKRELERFRKREAHENIMGNNVLHSKTILSSKNVFNEKPKRKFKRRGML